jgi:hypothetical protein
MNKLATSNNGDFCLKSATKPAGGVARPSRAQVEQAVSTLIRWIPSARGWSPRRRVWFAPFEEWFAGYAEDSPHCLMS